MHFFYIQLNKIGQLHEKVLLSKEESFHAIKVMRLKIGSALNVIDGSGNLYQSILVSENKGFCELEIVGIVHNYNIPFVPLHIAVAPTKQADRNEWFVEKAVELGASEISFIKCEHSERTVINLERLNKIVIAALKQSERSLALVLNPMIPFQTWVKSPLVGNKLIGHIGNQTAGIAQSIIKDMPHVVAIGPEGGFTDQEIEMSLKQNFKAVSLGNAKLRTETAVVAACTVVQIVNNP